MRRHEDWTRWKLYCKHFVPYGLLVLAIVSAVCLLMSWKAVRDVRANVNAQMAGVVETAAGFLESQFSDLDRIAYEIKTNRMLKPYELLLDSYASAQASRLLAPFVSANAYLADVFLIYSPQVFATYGAQQVVYSKQGPTHGNTLWNHIYAFTQTSFCDVNAWMPNVTKPRILYPFSAGKPVKGTSYLVYMIPLDIDPDSVNRRGLVLFVLDTQAMEQFFRPLFALYEGVLRVEDGQGNLVYSVDFTRTSPEALAETRADRATLDAPARAWRYTLDWYNSPFPSLSKSMIAIQLPAFLLLLVIGMGCAVVLSRIHFKPLSRLYDAILDYGKPPTVSFQGIVSSLEEMERQWDRLKYQMEKQRMFMRMQLLRTVLNGQYQSAEQLHAQLEENGLNLRANAYALCVLRLKTAEGYGTPSSEQMFAAQRYIERVNLLDGEARYCLLADNAAHVAVVFALPQEPHPQHHLQRFFDLVQKELTENLHCTVTGSASPWVRGLERLPDAYQQALRGFDRAFYFGYGMLYFAQTDPSGATGGIIWYPTQQEEGLMDALEAGSEAGVAHSIDALAQVFMALLPPSEVACSVCLSTVSRVLTHASRLQLIPDEEALARLRHLNAEGFDTLQDHLGHLRSLCADLCRQWKSRQVEKNALLCRQIAEYLRESFPQSSLTLPVVAERFDRSVAHIAKHFKQCYGKSVMQYLDEIRLEHARTLLALPQAIPLDEVLAACGYVDKSNFIRKFKRAYQITPVGYQQLRQRQMEQADGA